MFWTGAEDYTRFRAIQKRVPAYCLTCFATKIVDSRPELSRLQLVGVVKSPCERDLRGPFRRSHTLPNFL